MVPRSGWMVRFLQANDSFYPTGSYAHSFGLEGMIQENWIHDRATLREFIFASVVPSLRQNDLPVAALASLAFAARDWSRVGELCVLAAALKAPREIRTASEAIGRQRVELCANLQAADLASEFLQKADAAAWPIPASVATALEGAVHGAPVDAVLASIYYAALTSLMAAAMKLLRLGQNGAQSLLGEALAQAEEVIASARKIPMEGVGWFNPWLDIASARHETAKERLFIS